MRNTAARAADLPVFTLDQIARQLTHGYWQSEGEGWRAFSLGSDRVLTYDLGPLGKAEARLARTAFDAWSDATGIRFVEVKLPTPGSVFENGDAAAGPGTKTQVPAGDIFFGEIADSDDLDWVKVTLKAGTEYRIEALGLGGAEGLLDPILRLANAQGKVIAENDDANGTLDSALSFTPTRSGTYYLIAGTATEGDFGTYAMGVAEADAETADITFGNDDARSAYSTSETDGHTILSSHVNVGAQWMPDEPLSFDSYWFQTYVHEIGHALGLGHAGNYNGDAQFPRDAHYANDSVLNSVMSYFSADQNPNLPADPGYLATVMPADILAIRALYGSGGGTRTGDTVYGVNSTVGGYLGQIFAMVFDGAPRKPAVWQGGNIILTIHDDGGHDRLDFSTMNTAQIISLVRGDFSSVGGYLDNLAIGQGTVIEDAAGGRKADFILGNGIGNRLEGGSGGDTLLGGGGADTLAGGDGKDLLVGGKGRDLASFADATAALGIDLGKTGAQQTGQGRDTLRNIEDLEGGRGHDRLAGNAGANRLDGGAGNDTLTGRGGADTFLFGAGRDVIADFRAESDRIGFDRDLWGGAAKSGAAILDFARVERGAVVFSFDDGQSLTLRGIGSLAGLAEDLFGY